MNSLKFRKIVLFYLWWRDVKRRLNFFLTSISMSLLLLRLFSFFLHHLFPLGSTHLFCRLDIWIQIILIILLFFIINWLRIWLRKNDVFFFCFLRYFVLGLIIASNFIFWEISLNIKLAWSIGMRFWQELLPVSILTITFH